MKSAILHDRWVAVTLGAILLIIVLPGAGTALGESSGNRPNILWIYIEDMNPLLSCYGDPILKTPNLDRLAENGVLFEKCFTPAPVCSPCRSGLIVGMEATSFGAHNHRVYDKSEVLLPEGVQALPELFRKSGYYTFNAGKTDYNFKHDRDQFYDQQCSNRIKLPGNEVGEQTWKGYPKEKPFFGQLQREGGKHLFYYRKLYGMGGWDSRAFKMDPQTAAATLPSCYPTDPILLKNWAEHYDCVAVQDWDVGCILEDLENKNLLDNTIIFAFSDHGLFLPRHKQFCYDGGLHVPLIVSYFGSDPELQEKIQVETRRKDLVSLLDVTATSLALAGIDVPEWYESKDLFDPGYPMILVHSPFVATPDSADRKRRDGQRNFEDMVFTMDRLIGRLVKKTEELGIAGNTLILFTGDNGTHSKIRSELNGVTIRGGKGKTTDAGTRVPLIGYWPGTIPAGTVSNDLVDFSGFLPTLVEAAGTDVPKDIDGRSFLKQLEGKAGNPREWIYIYYSPRPEKTKPVYFIRDQRWKLYGDGRFYDVAADPLEADIADTPNGSKAAAAHAKLSEALTTVPREGHTLLKYTD